MHSFNPKISTKRREIKQNLIIEKYDQIDQSAESSYHCNMSQRDVEGFNLDLNIFSDKNKQIPEIDFTSSSFFKKKTELENISEKKYEECNQINRLSSEYSFYNQSLEKENERQNYNNSLSSHHNSISQHHNSASIHNNSNYNSQSNLNSSQKSNSQLEKKSIFSPFYSSYKQPNQYSMNNSIDNTRGNVFKQEYPQYIENMSVFKSPNNSFQQSSKIISKREMSVEYESDQKSEYKSNIPSQNDLNKNIQSYHNYSSSQLQSQQKSQQKQSIQKQQMEEYEEIEWNKKNDNKQMEIYETPNMKINQKKLKINPRLIDSSSDKQYNFNENSNSSNVNKFRRLNKHIDSTNIIQNPQSKKRLTRTSTNFLHESFQKQIFDSTLKNVSDKKRRSRQNNNKMNSEQEEKQIQIQNQNDNQSKKLKKLVKNKRQSETKNLKNIESQISQAMKNCAICLSFPEDNVYGRVQCSHEFCIDCIVQWSKVTNQCPMCRTDFQEIEKKNYNDSDDKQIIKVEQKKQRIHDEDEFYWEEASYDSGVDEFCYICETDQDEEKLIVCDHCGIRICHAYCDDEIFDDSVPLDDWFCHECRVRSELFY